MNVDAGWWGIDSISLISQLCLWLLLCTQSGLMKDHGQQARASENFAGLKLILKCPRFVPFEGQSDPICMPNLPPLVYCSALLTLDLPQQNIPVLTGGFGLTHQCMGTDTYPPITPLSCSDDTYNFVSLGHFVTFKHRLSSLHCLRTVLSVVAMVTRIVDLSCVAWTVAQQDVNSHCHLVHWTWKTTKSHPGFKLMIRISLFY